MDRHRIRLTLHAGLALLFAGLGHALLAGDAGLSSTEGKLDIQYGPHPGQVLDFWAAPADEPTPLVLFIHGGGFQKGDKKSLKAATRQAYLDQGTSVAGINYRMLPDWKLPTAHQDCRRALQFLRSMAREWNIDPDRIAAFGGSAGAQICMWLAFSPDMANPESADPIERYSTRLRAIAPTGGQATMDFDLWDAWLPGIPKVSQNYSNASWPRMYDVPTWDEALKLIHTLSAIDLISSDDPPVYLTYNNAPDTPIPDDFSGANSLRTHHVTFGLKLKDKLDACGVENHLDYPGHPTRFKSAAEFLLEKLK